MIFYTGKIYAVSYTRWQHDQKPLIFVFYSDKIITHAINLHYLSQPLLFQFISYVKKFEQRFPMWTNNLGKEMYMIFKRYYPLIVKTSYRTYFTKYLYGFLINEGITKSVQGMVDKFLPKDLEKKDFMVRAVDEALKIGSLINKMPTPVQEGLFFKPMLSTSTSEPIVEKTEVNNVELLNNNETNGENK